MTSDGTTIGSEAFDHAVIGAAIVLARKRAAALRQKRDDQSLRQAVTLDEAAAGLALLLPPGLAQGKAEEPV